MRMGTIADETIADETIADQCNARLHTDSYEEIKKRVGSRCPVASVTSVQTQLRRATAVAEMGTRRELGQILTTIPAEEAENLWSHSHV